MRVEKRKEDDAMDKMWICKTCGVEIAASAKSCLSCGAKNKPPVYKRIWFWLFVALVVIPVVGGIVGMGGDTNSANLSDETVSSTEKVVSTKSSVFDGDCGMVASAEMGPSSIGYPEWTISITNTTEQEISAVLFYAVPCGVYGDEIAGWTSQNKLYTDTAIGAGKSDSIRYQFMKDNVKTLKLYVYSVYFADGTVWGDQDATKPTILNNGAAIEVPGQS